METQGPMPAPQGEEMEASYARPFYPEAEGARHLVLNLIPATV